MADLNKLMEKIRLAEQNSSNVVFPRAQLQGADLRGINLRAAHLMNADLRGADLRGADLSETILSDANLSAAKLTGAVLSDANLQRANLRGADLEGVLLIRANLAQANLTQADFTEADLREAILSDANLSRANLTGAVLKDANLQRANLTLANLTWADLEGVLLFSANLAQANLRQADFTEADFTLANLTQANLTQANLTSAIFTNSVMLLVNLTGANLTGAIDVDFSNVINYTRQNPAPVDRNQVHKSASKIDYEKINEFLMSKIKETIPPNINYPQFIREKITGFISHVDESSKEEFIAGLNALMQQRLEGLNYATLSPDTRDSIFYALTYVSTQPPAFQKMYTETFIKDCLQASNGADGMTCVLGALERILFSLLPPCAGSESEDCETIVGIIEANPEQLVILYILDWYKLHKRGEFPEGVVDRREDLKKILKVKLPTTTDEWIEEKVKKYADYQGYEDESFDLGKDGGARKKRRTKKRRTKRNRRSKKSKRSKRRI